MAGDLLKRQREREQQVIRARRQGSDSLQVHVLEKSWRIRYARQSSIHSSSLGERKTSRVF